jgi:hypothetical protein
MGAVTCLHVDTASFPKANWEFQKRVQNKNTYLLLILNLKLHFIYSFLFLIPGLLKLLVILDQPLEFWYYRHHFIFKWIVLWIVLLISLRNVHLVKKIKGSQIQCQLNGGSENTCVLFGYKIWCYRHVHPRPAFIQLIVQ